MLFQVSSEDKLGEKKGDVFLSDVSVSLTLAVFPSSVDPCPQARLTSWVKENPGSWFSEFKRGKLVSPTLPNVLFPFPERLLYFAEQNGKMAQRHTRHMV